MKAIVWTKYGSPDGLQLKEVTKPAPKDNQVLIKIHAATVSAGDCELRGARFPIWLWLPLRIYMGFLQPRNIILGQELAGEIETTGKEVTNFKPGDPVFAWTGLQFGGYAEYACLDAKGLIAIKPVNLTYAEAAALPVGGPEALYFLRKANIQRGEKILINGAGGSIGTIAVQLAKYFGCEVTAVDSTGKLEMLRSIGADHVIDYTQEDFTRRDETYNVIIDVPVKSPFARSIRSLKQGGRYLANIQLSRMILGRWLSRNSTKQVIFGSANPKLEDFAFLKELIEAGKIKPVIDRHYSLEQTPEAHRYVDSGQKKGNVIIVVE